MPQFDVHFRVYTCILGGIPSTPLATDMFIDPPLWRSHDVLQVRVAFRRSLSYKNRTGAWSWWASIGSIYVYGVILHVYMVLYCMWSIYTTGNRFGGLLMSTLYKKTKNKTCKKDVWTQIRGRPMISWILMMGFSPGEKYVCSSPSPPLSSPRRNRFQGLSARVLPPVSVLDGSTGEPDILRVSDWLTWQVQKPRAVEIL